MPSQTIWLLLLYKVAREPSARRVYIWRKLKRLGALLLHDAVWVLPATPRTREQFQWLAAEIGEMGGEALCWEAQLAAGGPEAALVEKFVARTDSAYQALLKQLKQPEPDLAAVSQQYQQLKQQDYFQSQVGQKVRAALVAAWGGETE
jgi:hypothetical protein